MVIGWFTSIAHNRYSLQMAVFRNAEPRIVLVHEITLSCRRCYSEKNSFRFFNDVHKALKVEIPSKLSLAYFF